MDVQKVFDTIPHQHSLQKFTLFGIHGNVLQWIESFLSSRKQQVVLNCHKSCSIPVISGVTQGSVLGPLLLMFVTEMPSIVSSLELMFADNTKIFCAIRNMDDYYNTALQNTVTWIYFKDDYNSGN